jgi:integrase
LKNKGASPRVVRRTLADGTVKEYCYGPRRAADEVAAQNIIAGTLAAAILAWHRSPEWSALRASTQKNYVHHLRPIHHAMKAARLTAIERSHLMLMRNEIALTRGPGAALNFCRAVGAFFTWALDHDLIKISPAIRLARKLHRGHLPAWTDEQAERAMRDLPEPYRRAVVLAYHTGQRRGDLCAMRWTDYDERNGVIRLIQEKTEEPVAIPVLPELRDELARWKADRSSFFILEHRGKPWRPGYLTQWLPDHLARIGLPRLGLHGLRRLTAIRLAENGASPAEIAGITGHRSLSMIQEYTRGVNQARLARQAMAKLGKLTPLS